MNRENLKIYKVVIVGAGVSGLALASMLADKIGGDKILLIERLDRVGKKILSTGNGQCNVANIDYSCTHYHSHTHGVVESIIEKYDLESITEFFKSIGIYLSQTDGKFYPISRQANAVLDALREKIVNSGVNLVTNQKVISIEKSNPFIISTAEGGVYHAQNVVVSAGGKSAKHLGTDGTSYSLLTAYGHTLTPLYPSLVQLKTETNAIKGLKGLKQKVNVTAVVDNKQVASKVGDVLFTEYGVSGNAIFYLSSYVIESSEVCLKIDFCPEKSLSEVKEMLLGKIKNCPYTTLSSLLSGILVNKIGEAVIRRIGYNNLSQIATNSDVDKISTQIKNYTLKVLGTMGFNNSQVTRGGISLSEFNNCTLESKLQKGLYATGEILDVDGDCGGYNISWAIASAMAVCKGIN